MALHFLRQNIIPLPFELPGKYVSMLGIFSVNDIPDKETDATVRAEILTKLFARQAVVLYDVLDELSHVYFFRHS
jgi:hypothetical protein